jgi:Ran GTPase-activating protein (RanGAP) involved in mRNA processing and transport
VIDISDTPIGNYGAACIAAVLTLCDQLEEIRLSNCGIKDDGAISLFEELKNAQNVKSVELSNNPITEKAFDALIGVLEKNKSI